MQESSDSTDRSAQRGRCLRLHPDDNVAVALSNLQPGSIEILGTSGEAVMVAETIAQGHKVALRSIDEQQPIVKCGAAIGFATSPVAAGRWVHTHNCRSGLDERSHTLDLHSGAPTDTRYV